MGSTNSLQLDAQYRKYRRRDLWRIANVMGSSEAEDILHEAWIERLTNPRATSMRILIRAKCSESAYARRNVDIGLPVSLAHASRLQEAIERRELAIKAARVLTRGELAALLEEYDKRPPPEHARVIRIARRKARRALDE